MALITNSQNTILTNGGSSPVTQVQSNWTEADTASPAYIQNKPDMADYVTDDDLSTALSGKKDKQTAYSFSENARQTVSSLSQNEDGNVTVNSTKSVGSEYTVVHSGSTSNKFAKIAEFSCYSGFSWVGSGFSNLVVSVSDASGARQATISVGITQAANGNHNFAAALRYYVTVNQSSTMELKSVYLFSDTPYGDNQTQATISLWAEFTDLSQKQWTFKAENNFATPGTGGSPKTNVWEFANGQRYPVSALPTGGWQLNSKEPTYSVETPDWNAPEGSRSYIANKPESLPTKPSSSYKQYSLMYSTNPGDMAMFWSLKDSRNLSTREATVGLNSSYRIEITQYMLDNGIAYIYLDKNQFPDLGGGFQWWDVKLWGLQIYKQNADLSLAGTEWDIPLMLTTSQIATPASDLNTAYLTTLRFKWTSTGLFTDYQGCLAFTVDLLNDDTNAMFIKFGLTGYTGSLAVGDTISVLGRVRPCTNIM